MVNILWAGMFLTAVLYAFFKLIFFQSADLFELIVQAVFDNAQAAVSISIGLIGILSFWLGILKLAEESGIALKISQKLSPLFSVLMKDVPKNSPALSLIAFNMAANFLGLDNAATPMGIKAMEQLQEHNKTKDQASDAQILFMILNASSVTLLPITVFMYRAQMGASRPTEVFIPILLATLVSTLTGFLLVAFKQKIKLSHPILLKWLFSGGMLILGIAAGFYMLSPAKRLAFSAASGNILLLLIIFGIIFFSLQQKVKCYEVFVLGAKEGLQTALNILPYLLAMLVAVGVFRAAGIFDILVEAIQKIFRFFNIDCAFSDALLTAFMKPLSGSGARAMMIETMQNFGADSFAAFCSSVIQGSTETTFYVLTVYFGAVKISKVRYALSYALCSDLAGIIAAILFSYMFYVK